MSRSAAIAVAPPASSPVRRNACATPLSPVHADLARPATRSWRDPDLHVASQAREILDQAIERKSPQPTVRDQRQLRRLFANEIRRFRLRHLPIAQDAPDLLRQLLLSQID